jgi:hypothetical protein
MAEISTAVSVALVLMFLGGMISGTGLMKRSKKTVVFGILLVLFSITITRDLLSHLELRTPGSPVIRYIYPWEMKERSRGNFLEIQEVKEKHPQKIVCLKINNTEENCLD